MKITKRKVHSPEGKVVNELNIAYSNYRLPIYNEFGSLIGYTLDYYQHGPNKRRNLENVATHKASLSDSNIYM